MLMRENTIEWLKMLPLTTLQQTLVMNEYIKT